MLPHSLRTGLSFGLTSGTITTLGLMVGLASGTHSRLVVIGGILTIAIADAFSDALGIHVAEESEGVHTVREVWEATIATFLAKFLYALTFIIPVLFLQLWPAVIVSAVWGLSVLGIQSYRMGLAGKEGPWGVVREHLFIAVVVILLTHYVGQFISVFFN
jgi:VIT1/CCC1 family predicted Fe2+/Mn2+ transporter